MKLVDLFNNCSTVASFRLALCYSTLMLHSFNQSSLHGQTFLKTKCSLNPSANEVLVGVKLQLQAFCCRDYQIQCEIILHIRSFFPLFVGTCLKIILKAIVHRHYGSMCLFFLLWFLFFSDFFCKTRWKCLQMFANVGICTNNDRLFEMFTELCISADSVTFYYLKYSSTVWLFLERICLNPCSPAFLKPVTTLRSSPKNFVCLLLKHKSASNPRNCSLVKLVFASADLQIDLFWGSKVDKVISTLFIITR